MPGLTTRLKLPWTKLEDGADIEQATQPLAESLDASMLIQIGTPVDPLPTPVPVAGCWFMRINGDGSLNRLYMSTGTMWVQVSVGAGSFPIAGIMGWAVPGTDPSDPNVAGGVTWRRCTGGTVLVTDYPSYATIVGTTWGGNGSTTVGIPDFQGRTLIGENGGEAPLRINPPNVMGATGGVEKLALTVDQMPIHSHRGDGQGGFGGKTDPANAPDHTHDQPGNTPFGTHRPGDVINWPGVGPQPFVQGSSPSTGGVTNGAAALSHAHPISADGSGTQHNNMQPFAVIRWYIRIR